MVCVLSFGFLCSMQENLMVFVVLNSLEHLNEYFRSIVEKVCGNAASFHNAKGTIITKINPTLLLNISIIINARNVHSMLQH